MPSTGQTCRSRSSRASRSSTTSRIATADASLGDFRSHTRRGVGPSAGKGAPVRPEGMSRSWRGMRSPSARVRTGEFAGDPPIAPAWVLACQAQHELVAKHHNLELLELRGARAQQDELDQPAQRDVEKRGKQVRSPSVKGTEARELYGRRGGRPCSRPRHNRVCAPHTR